MDGRVSDTVKRAEELLRHEASASDRLRLIEQEFYATVGGEKEDETMPLLEAAVAEMDGWRNQFHKLQDDHSRALAELTTLRDVVEKVREEAESMVERGMMPSTRAYGSYLLSLLPEVKK